MAYRELKNEKLYDNALRFLHHPQGYKSKKQVKAEAKLKKRLEKQYKQYK